MLMTKDYSQFVVMNCRETIYVDDPLVMSMKQHGFIPAYPLHCHNAENGKIFVKDGRRRFFVAEYLGLEVCFVVTDDTATAAYLEQTKRPWSLDDYVNYYADQSIPSYLQILDWQRRTSFPVGMVAAMLRGATATSKHPWDSVKDGLFEVVGTYFIDKVAYCANAIRDLGYAWHNEYDFVAALSHCSRIDGFEKREFEARAIIAEHLLARQVSINDYLVMIEQVMNYRSASPICLIEMHKAMLKEDCRLDKIFRKMRKDRSRKLK